MKNFKIFLQESIVDPKREEYAPAIFNNATTDSPTLKPAVKKTIELGIQKISKLAPIVDYVLIGSIVTKRYRDDADLDINVLIDAPEEIHNQVVKFVKTINDKPYPGTNHPINYHVLRTDDDFNKASDMADAVFDIKNNKFIKKDSEADFNIEKYMAAFQKKVQQINSLKDELKDNLVDYEYLQSLSRDNIKNLKKRIAAQIKELEKDAQDISYLYHKIKNDRKDAFKTQLTAQQIRDYGSHNKLPANVIYKLLEKYYYLEFLRKVDDILGDDNRLSPTEADRLVKEVE